MPRTKLTKKVTNKRNRNSTIDELRVNAIGEVDRGKCTFSPPFSSEIIFRFRKKKYVFICKLTIIFCVCVCAEMEAILVDFTFKQEQKRDQIRNHINNTRSKLSANILTMKIGYLKELLEQSVCTYDQVQDQISSNMGVLANITNQTLNNMNITSSAKVSRTDDGKMHIIIVLLRFFFVFAFFLGGLVLTKNNIICLFFSPHLLFVQTMLPQINPNFHAFVIKTTISHIASMHNNNPHKS